MALIFETKVALFEAVRALSPAGVQVTFAETGSADRRRSIWFGSTVDDDMQAVAMKDGPRKPTTVTGYIEVHAYVIYPGDPVAAERAVYELRDVIVAACPNVDRRAVRGLLDVRPESAVVDTGETTDGTLSGLTMRVRVRGRVTQ